MFLFRFSSFLSSSFNAFDICSQLNNVWIDLLSLLKYSTDCELKLFKSILSFNYLQEENNIKILYNNNHIANAFIDNDELIIESKPSNEKTINALSPSQAPIIKNSVLVNIEDFIDVENSEDELESNVYNGESAIANA